MRIIKITLTLLAVIFLVGCETGIKNKTLDKSIEKETVQSGIVSKTNNYKPYTPKDSEITKIFSKTGTPGYYVQVGYFKTKMPNSEFLSRMKYAQLPYTILEKYKNGLPHYHALVGPYKSYNQANEIKITAKEFVTDSAFIVKVVRP